MRKKMSMMLLSSRRRPDSEPRGRRRSEAPPEVHQLPPRPARRAGDPEPEPGLGDATAGRIVVDGGPDEEDGGPGDGSGDEGGDEHGGAGTDAAESPDGSRTRRRRRRRRPCARCAAIDFPRILDWRPGQPRPWIPLAHVVAAHPAPPPSPPASTDGALDEGPFSSAAAPDCPYCAFFRAMLCVGGGDGGGGCDRLVMGGKFTPYLRIRQAFERLDGVGEKHELAPSVLGEVMARHRALPRGYIVKADDDGVDAYRAAAGAPARIRGRVVTPVLDPAVLRCWLDHCRDAHGATCAEVEEPIPGLRLVDCRERRVVRADCVVDERRAVEYVTLSYVWGRVDDDGGGGARHSATGDDGWALPERLPTVFADAVTLTLSLGLRFLWIDRYCLMPLAAGEQRRQLARMGDILGRSALTVIAAAGEGADDGLRGVSAARPAQLALQTTTGLFTTTLARAEVEVAASRWATRAWTLQEGLLARRRLVLAASQAYFQCRALHCHESVALPLRLAAGVGRAGRVFPPAAGVVLREHIRAFMARDLARPADRLDAFGSILRAFERLESRPVAHLLGLPLFHPDAWTNTDSDVVSQTDRLAVALGWIPGGPRSQSHGSSPPVDGGGDGDSDDNTCCSAMDGAPFPSWTWLAWKLRPARDGGCPRFRFNLVDEASHVIDGVSAPPGMELSIGFGDGAVLSWEIDGDAIARKTEPVAFVRLETYCADLGLRRGGPGPWPSWVLDSAVPLSRDNRDAIEAWIRAAPPPSPPSSSPSPSPSPSNAATPPAVPDHRLTAVLVSGHGWRAAAPAAATALICHHRGWDPAAPLVRLGAISIAHDGFVPDGRHALIKGAAQGAAHAESDLRVCLRELDLY